MQNLDEASFKKQIKILYYSKMLHVAQALFERGSKDSSIALSLLVPIAVVKAWRKLYEEGELLNVPPNNVDSQEAILPFVNASSETAGTEFSSDTKRVAIALFEMGLPSRTVALYLDAPISTVYYWHGLFKKNQCQTGPVAELEPYVFTGLKYKTTNTRRRYSYEARQVAKECFEKGMSTVEIAQYLGIDRLRVAKWKRALEKGRFYVNEQERLLYAHRCQKPNNDPSLLEKKAAKELFEMGVANEVIAATIHVSFNTISSWKSLYDKGELHTDFDSIVANEEPVREAAKTDSGRYTIDVRQAAKECFDRGFGYKLTAKQISVSQAVARDWCRLYKEGRFKPVK